MNRGSIRLRLWAAGGASMLLALVLAGVGLSNLFERHVERRVEAELAVQLNALIAATSFQDGSLRVAPPNDPRFAEPLSGYYWQVEDLATGVLVRSRSLWDGTLKLTSSPSPETQHLEEIDGLDGETLIVLDRTVTDASGVRFRAAVAEGYATVSTSVAEFTAELVPALLLLGMAFLAANFIQITVGLAPLKTLRAAVADVITGRRTRLDASAPREVQPLAKEIDRLLDSQEKELGRARVRATDLAHGLKTPLQVLSSDIRTLRDKGERELADEIEKSVSAIRRHIERELTRARLARGPAASTRALVRACVTRIVDVVRRTPAGSALDFQVNVPETLTAPMEEADLAELLGNLVENAARFARTRVVIAAAQRPDGVELVVSDDGPGVPAADREAVLARGVRLDRNGPGTGLGLAIVADVVEAYGGRLALEDARPGLRVCVLLSAGPR